MLTLLRALLKLNLKDQRFLSHMLLRVRCSDLGIISESKRTWFAFGKAGEMEGQKTGWSLKPIVLTLNCSSLAEHRSCSLKNQMWCNRMVIWKWHYWIPWLKSKFSPGYFLRSFRGKHSESWAISYCNCVFIPTDNISNSSSNLRINYLEN